MRSVFSDILLRFAGGGPSLSEDMPSGAGEPFCECCCEAGGEGYAVRSRVMLAGGEGERDSSESGEHDRDEAGALLSGEESPEASLVMAAIVNVRCRCLS